MTALSLLNGAAAITTIFAAIMVASNWSARVMTASFCVFILASVLWMLSGYLDQQPSLVVQNAVLLLVNIFGVWRWWPRVH